MLESVHMAQTELLVSDSILPTVAAPI
jgi:hypothetical protein